MILIKAENHKNSETPCTALKGFIQSSCTFGIKLMIGTHLSDLSVCGTKMSLSCNYKILKSSSFPSAFIVISSLLSVSHCYILSQYWILVVGFILDIDECAENIHNCSKNNATCTNSKGSFNCSCNTGFRGDGYNCSGISYYSEREIFRKKRTDLHLRITMYILTLKSFNRDVYHSKSRSK